MHLLNLASVIGIILVSTPAVAQDRVLEPPPHLFQGAVDSMQIRRSYAAGFMEASAVILQRPPLDQLYLWRQKANLEPEDLFVPELLWIHFGIRLEVVSGDTLTEAELAHFAGYNRAVEETLKREHGTDVLEKIAEESRAQYLQYREKSSPSNRNPK